MSALNYIEPSFDSSKLRAEFKIPLGDSGVYKNDFRILNIGAIKTNNGNSEYNTLCGAYGLIRDIAVYNGAQLLDQVQNFNIYTGVKNLLHPNHENISVHRNLARNKLGYVSQGNDVVTEGAFAEGNLVTNTIPNTGNIVYGADATATNKWSNYSWLDLSECLGFFREHAFIPMNVYGDLRIVVTYVNSNAIAWNVKAQNSTLETVRPTLVCESEPNVELAEQMMNSYQGVTFNSVEHDLIAMPAVAVAQNTLEEQEVAVIAKGFNNKYISKVVLVNTMTDSTSWVAGGNSSSFANNGSTAQFEWLYQARVNGQNVFPNAWKYGKMRTLGTLTDIWGDQNITFGQNWCGVSGGGDKVMQAPMRDTIGQASYSALAIDDVVQELRLNVARNAVGGTNADATLNNNLRQRLNINIFGLSRKQIIPTDMGLVIRYV